MAEDGKKTEEGQPTPSGEAPKEKVFSDFIGSKEYIDHVNALKGDFLREKTPEIREKYKDELMKELNPDETPEAKRIKALEDAEAKRKTDQLNNERLGSLKSKAKELGVSEDRALDYVVYGDKAVETFESHIKAEAERTKSIVETAVEEALKTAYPGRRPPSGDPQSHSQSFAERMGSAVGKIK